MENQQPIARLSFTCDRNWEDMTAVEGGRFCNDCQKKVIDFTDKTNDEIAAYLMSSTTQVCGKFTNYQLAPSLPKPVWKRWLSAAAMFVTVFIGIKEASAQSKAINDTTRSSHKTNVNTYALGGEIVLVRNNFPSKIADTVIQSQKPYSFADLEVLPSISGDEKAFIDYINKNIHIDPGTKGRVIVSCVIAKNGKLINIKILRGLNSQTNQEVVKAMKESPAGKPGIMDGKAVDVLYTIPVYIDK
jgi:hypothetical protein